MNQHPCPSCGYCPTCGRKGSPHGTYPWTTAPLPHWQPKPIWVNPYQVTWQGNTYVSEAH